MGTFDREILRGFLLAAAALALSGPVSVADGTAGDEGVDLQVGEPAPVFTSIDDEGNAWTLSDHVGEGYVVVFFYPADFGSCCKLQAQSYRDHMKALSDRGVQVVGVSGDRAANHRLFKEAWRLNFTLLADEQARVAGKYGVPSRKGGRVRPHGPDRKPITGPHGKPLTLHREATMARWTFVIGENGTIIYKTTGVAAPRAAEQVLEFIERLTQEEPPIDIAFAR